MRVSILVASVLSLVMAGCGNYHEDYRAPFFRAPLTGFKGFTTLSYESVKEIVFKTNCWECHSSDHVVRRGVNLQDYNNVLEKLAKIESETMSDEMPKASAGYPPVPPEQKDVLIAWIRAGAPFTSDIPIPGLDKLQMKLDLVLTDAALKGDMK